MLRQLAGPNVRQDLGPKAGQQELDRFSSDDEGEGAQLLQLVGRGAFGAVYKALYRGRLAAVKVRTAARRRGPQVRQRLSRPLWPAGGGA